MKWTERHPGVLSIYWEDRKMSTETQAGRSTDSGIESLQKGRGVMMILGIALMVMGLLAIVAMPFVAGLAAVLWVAVLLLIGGCPR